MPALIPPFLLAPCPALCCCLPQPIPSLLTLYIKSGYDLQLIGGLLTFFPPSAMITISDLLVYIRKHNVDPKTLLLPSPLLNAVLLNLRAPQPSPPSIAGFYVLHSPPPLPRHPYPTFLSSHLPPLACSQSRYLSTTTVNVDIAVLPRERSIDSGNCITYFTMVGSIAVQVAVPPSSPSDPPLSSWRIRCSSMSIRELKNVILTRGGTVRTGMEKPEVVDLAISLHREATGLPVVIYSHGNAADVGLMSLRICEIAIGCSVIVMSYDYSGYGSSGGIPTPPEASTRDLPRGMEIRCTEEATYENVKCVYEYVSGGAFGADLESILGRRVEMEGVFLYGQSVGSGPTSWLGSVLGDGGSKVECGVGRVCCAVCCCDGCCCTKSKKKFPVVSRGAVDLLGVVLHSPFLSGLRVLTPNRLLSSLDIFPNVDRVGGIREPVMVIHGLEDEEIGVDHGIQLSNAANARWEGVQHWWVKDRGHNDVTENNMVEYIHKLSGFLEYCRRAKREGVQPRTMDREGGEEDTEVAESRSSGSGGTASIAPGDVEIH